MMRSLLKLSAFLLVSGWCSAVLAQEVSDVDLRSQPVSEREHDDYAAQGVRLGSFVFFPRMEVDEGYTDNLYAVARDEKDDWITTVHPSFSLISDFANHEIRLDVGAELVDHGDYSDEDVENYNAALYGELNVSRALILRGQADWLLNHGPRSSPDDRDGKEPTEYDTLTLMLGGNYKPGRFSLDLEGKVEDADYDDVERLNGTPINNDDRDRVQRSGTLKAAYEVRPEYDAFVSVSLNQREHDDRLDDNGLKRDSDGYEILLGADVDLTGKLLGDVALGYLAQDYDDARLDNISGWSASVHLKWLATPLTTVGMGLTRSIHDTTMLGASGTLQTKSELQVDHELRRNILLGAGAIFKTEEYKGLSRDDDTMELGLRGRYLLNRYVYTELDYRYTDKSSDDRNAEYDENRVLLTVGLQY